MILKTKHINIIKMEYAIRIQQPEKQGKISDQITPNNVIEVTSLEHRNKLINENEIVVIKYGAEWCGPCKRIKPDYDKMCKDDVSNRCVYLTEDIDEEYDEYSEDIISIPAFHIYKNKSFVKSIVGANMKMLSLVIEDLKK